MKFVKLCLIGVFTLIGTAHVNASLILNGSFENGAFVPNKTTGVGEFDTASSVLTGWTIIHDEIHWLQSPNVFQLTASDGVRFLDLTAFQGDSIFGGIQQTFTTEIGATYQVVFDIGSHNQYSASERSVIRVEANDQGQTFSGSVAQQTNLWETASYTFVANSSSTVLKFTSPFNSSAYVGLDNISVEKIADFQASVPSTFLLFVLALIVIIRSSKTISS